jgi:hypothetical protein
MAPRRELDRDVYDIGNLVDEWVAKRNANGVVLAYFRRVPQIVWPALQEAEDLSHADGSGVDEDGLPVLRYGMRKRRGAIKNGQYVFRWERPPKGKPAKKDAEASDPGENPSQMGQGTGRSAVSQAVWVHLRGRGIESLSEELEMLDLECLFDLPQTVT